MRISYPILRRIKFKDGRPPIEVISPKPERSYDVERMLRDLSARENLDGIVCVCRIDGQWATTWSAHVDLGGLSMAALKLLNDVQIRMHGDEPLTWSPPEGDSA